MDFWTPSLIKSLNSFFNSESKPMYILYGPKNYNKATNLLRYFQKNKKNQQLTIYLEEISKTDEITACILEHINKPSNDVSIESLTKSMIEQTKHEELDIIFVNSSENNIILKNLFAFIEQLLIIRTFLTYKLKLLFVFDTFPTSLISNNFKLTIYEKSTTFKIPPINKSILIEEIERTIVNHMNTIAVESKNKKQTVNKLKNKAADYISSALFNTITDPGFYTSTTKRIITSFIEDENEGDFLYFWKKEVTGIITSCLTSNHTRRNTRLCDDTSVLNKTERILYLAVFWCNNVNKYFDDNVFSSKREGKQTLKYRTKTKYFTKGRLFKMSKLIGSRYMNNYRIDNRSVNNAIKSFKYCKIICETNNGKSFSSKVSFNGVLTIADDMGIKIQQWRWFLK
eukprot:GAHX01001777.1.p1 GENE.GAHX01001777.1~~GAHX01001777.1.p1  ORF type:complete len:415 (-),score=73.69 GAHX01001777.1:431-1627(-)